MSIEDMRKNLHYKIMMFRYGAKLTMRFKEIASMLLELWKFLRGYPDFLADVYVRLEAIAKKRGVKKIPKPLINMKVEGELH